MQRLSVVIANHNYEQFVAHAVDSALALEWDDLEVVVVDDGSTDGSVELLRAYGDRIILHLQENAGQRAAVNAGFALSSGDVVVFLDSDDQLPPELPRHLHRVITPSVSKVQLQAQRIDADGDPIGEPFPSYRRTPSAATLRRWMTKTTAYPTPPGSANAYARWFLERVMPVEDTGDQAADSALLAAAPLVGDVVTVKGVLIGYRRHGENDSRMLADPTRFAREVRRAESRWHFAQRTAGLPDVDGALRCSRELLQLRAAASRVAPAEPALPGDDRSRLLADAVRSPFHIGPEPFSQRALVAGWTLGVLLTPTSVARWLVKVRYGGA